MVEEKTIIAISFCIFNYTTEIKQKSIKPDTDAKSVEKIKDSIILVKKQFNNFNNFLNEVTNNINDSNIIEIDLGQNSYDIINKNDSNKYDTIFMYEDVYKTIDKNIIKETIKNKYDFYSIHKINSNKNEISNGDITLYDKNNIKIDTIYNIAKEKKINNSINEICNISLLINNINLCIDFYNINYLNNNKIQSIHNSYFYNKNEYNEKILELPKEIFNNYILQKYVNIPIIKKIHAAYIPFNEHGIGKFEKINEFIPSNIKYDSTQISEQITLKDIQLIVLDFDKVNNLITEGETKLIKIDQNEIDSAYEYFQQLETKINKSIITYVKINNTTPKIFNNKRFEIKIHENNKKMLIRYNEDEENYYSKENENSPYKLKSNVMNKYEKPKIIKYDYKSDDDKSVKETPTNSKIDDDRQYLLGNFTHIFKPNEKNKNMVDKMDHILKLIKKDNPPPIFIIGYGSSGAGKTSNLIYYRSTDEKNNEDGILPFLCKKIIQNEIKPEENEIKIILKTQELYKSDKTQFNSNTYYFDYDKEKNEIFLNNNNDNDRNIKIKHSYRFNFNQNDELLKDSIFEADPKNMNSNPPESSKKSKEDKTKQNKTQDINKTIKKDVKLGELIQFLVDVDRIVKSTTNNPQSSRSHVLVFVDMIINKKIINLIVGDFAGIENEFICNDNTLNEMSEQKNTLSKNVNEKGEKETFYMHQPILNKDFNNFDTYRGGEQIEDIAFDSDKTNIDEKIIEIEKYFQNNNYENFYEIQKNHDETIKNPEFLLSFKKDLNIKTFVKKKIMDNYNMFFKDKYKSDLKNSEALKTLNNTKTTKSEKLKNLNSNTNGNMKNKISAPMFSIIFKSISNDVFKIFFKYSFIINSATVYLHQDNNLYKIIRNITIFGEICKYLIEYDDYINSIHSASSLKILNAIKSPTRRLIIDIGKEEKKTIDLKSFQDVYDNMNILFDNKFNTNISTNTNILKQTLFYIDNTLVIGSEYVKVVDPNAAKITLISELPQGFYLNFTYIDSMMTENHLFPDNKTKKVSVRAVEGKLYCNVDILTEIKKFEKDINDLKQSCINYFQTFEANELLKRNLSNEINALQIQINEFVENRLNDNNIDQGHIYKYFVNNQDELFNYFYLTILKKYMLYTACNNRREEGTWINSSLENIRKAIQYIVQSKDFNIFYNYIDSCLSNTDQHYSPENLGLLIKQEELKEELKNNIFIDLIHKNLLVYRGEEYNILQMAKDMVICVYCVFNFSPKINDPPKSPYYNINFLNEIRNINDLKDIIQNKEKIQIFLNKLTRLMYRTKNNNNNNNVFDNNDTTDIFKKAKVYPINDEEKEAFGQIVSDEYVLLHELITKILTIIIDNSNNKNNEDIFYDAMLKGIIMICRVINIINATSSMGSLEFIDQIAKLNTTQYLCEYNEEYHKEDSDENNNNKFVDVTTTKKK